MNQTFKIILFLLLACSTPAFGDEPASKAFTLPTADGFRGIWYANQPSGDEYQFKYSGGLGTYPQQHLPIALYSEKANKTFFCYGGRPKEKNTLQHMISYYDHQTGKLAAPRILLNKGTSDAHDNPVMQIDGEGYIWIFSNSHGTSRPSFIHRSEKPFEIDRFVQIRKTNFSYGQPWYLEDHGFLFLHTLYKKGKRVLHFSKSPNGIDWDEPAPLSAIEAGHYQVSWKQGNKVGTAFNFHPEGQGLNWRTNLYYLETTDGGNSWTTVEGEKVSLPLTKKKNPALISEYQSKKQLVYMKDLDFTKEGHPVILFLTSQGFESGPKNDPRIFHTIRWTGSDWETKPITQGDNNYDYASLFIETDGTWRLIGTTTPGPQRFNTGGEMQIRTSTDQGDHWKLLRQLTSNSEWNQTYPRKPVNAHPDFYSLWADGHGRELSPSRLYFTNQSGTKVYQLPEAIENRDHIAPVSVISTAE